MAIDRDAVIKQLDKCLENEYSGVLRYSHYSLMVFGFNRIPIVSWLRTQSTESLQHAESIGEEITALGGHPSLKIAPLLETHKHSVKDILEESLEHEQAQIKLYEGLLELVEGKDIALEEFCRTMIQDEVNHCHEVEKMLRQS